MLKTLSTNKLTSNPAFPKILAAYNERLQKEGKVSGLKFFHEVILPEIPDYDLSSWYYFLKRFKTSVGIPQVVASVKGSGENDSRNLISNGVEESMTEVSKTFLSNNEATQNAIAAALNISARALKDLIENPELIPVEKRAELFLKVMKAQDSRVKAIGTIRADNRDQERFERAMSNSAFA